MRRRYLALWESNLGSVTRVSCFIQIIHSTMTSGSLRFRLAARATILFSGEKIMRSKLTLLAILAVASAASAKDPKTYQTGKLMQMDSVSCGMAEKDAKSFAGEVLGTDSGSKKTQEVLCQEYVLQAERVIYRIRPRDEKHPVLLPVGDQAQFRLQKDKMLLRVEDLDSKEREYIVVSMTPRSDSTAADATPVHMNHLQ
jgi:hypothetical protein